MTIKPKAAQEIIDIIAERDNLRNVLKELIDAADYTVSCDNSIAAMLRFGEADKVARALLAKAKSCAP